MSIANTYVVTEKIGGVEYKAQFSGISTALKAADQSKIDGSDAISTEKFAQYLFDHVIVEPKGLTPDHFNSLKEFNDVVAFARGVMQGDFREKADEGAAAKKSGK